MDALGFFRVVLGLVFYLFIPGFTVTLAIFPRGEVDMVERITLSFAFSITLMPFIILLLNMWLGVETFPIDLLHSIIASLGVIALSLVVWFVRGGSGKKSTTTP